MTPDYMRVLAARMGTLVDMLAELQQELFNIAAPPESTQRRLTGLFTTPLTGAARKLTPYERIAPAVYFGFQDTAAAAIRVLPKPNHGASPESCLNIVELDYSGTSLWFTLEVACSPSELVGAQRYQLSIHAHPDRPIGVMVVLRLPQKDGKDLDHHFANLKITPERRATVASGELKLPDFDSHQDRAPTLLFFFDSDRDLKLRLDYINVYFA